MKKLLLSLLLPASAFADCSHNAIEVEARLSNVFSIECAPKHSLVSRSCTSSGLGHTSTYLYNKRTAECQVSTLNAYNGPAYIPYGVDVDAVCCRFDGKKAKKPFIKEIFKPLD